MGRRYKIPLLSKIALWVSRWLIPNRVHAWIWINAYVDLDRHYRSVKIMDEDGFTLCDAVDSVRVENLRRKLYREYLRCTVD